MLMIFRVSRMYTCHGNLPLYSSMAAFGTVAPSVGIFRQAIASSGARRSFGIGIDIG
jgi:hypothetical protein